MSGALDWTLALDRTLALGGLVAVLGAGMVAGVFFAFSGFVMPGLGHAPAAVGIQAMQEINRAATRPPLMLALFGTGAVGLVVAVASAIGRAPGWPLTVAGTATYLGCVVVTVAYHVPRNDALASLDPPTPASVPAWRTYVTEWSRANHLRTLLAASGCVLLIMGWAR